MGPRFAKPSMKEPMESSAGLGPLPGWNETIRSRTRGLLGGRGRFPSILVLGPLGWEWKGQIFTAWVPCWAGKVT